MRWHAQVLHVMWKDLRQARWLLIAYAALVAIGTLRASLLLDVPGDLVLAVPLVVLVGMLTCAFLVQADSPARSDAFWASRPFQPLALPAAKLLSMAVVLLGLGLVGQLVALRAHGVSTALLPRLLLNAAVWYGTFLVLAAAIAALTRDLRSFIVGGVLFVVGWSLIDLVADIGIKPTESRAAFIITAGLLIILHQYRTRNPRRGTLLALPAAAVIMLLPSLVPSREPPFPGSVPPELRLGNITATDLQPSAVPDDYRFGGRRHTLELLAGNAAPGYRYVVRRAQLTVTTPDGRRTAVSVPTAPVTLVTPSLALDLDWLNDAVRSPVTGLTVFPDPSGVSLLSQPAARAELRLDVAVEKPHRMASLPYRRGSTAQGGGYRIHILRAQPDQPRLELQVTGAAERLRAIGMSYYWWSARLELALENRRRGEALALAGGLQSSARVSDLLLLPSNIPWRSLWSLGDRSRSGRAEPAIADASWLADAELVVTEWVPIGVYADTVPVGLRR